MRDYSYKPIEDKEYVLVPLHLVAPIILNWYGSFKFKTLIVGVNKHVLPPVILITQEQFDEIGYEGPYIKLDKFDGECRPASCVGVRVASLLEDSYVIEVNPAVHDLTDIVILVDAQEQKIFAHVTKEDKNRIAREGRVLQ